MVNTELNLKVVVYSTPVGFFLQSHLDPSFCCYSHSQTLNPGLYLLLNCRICPDSGLFLLVLFLLFREAREVFLEQCTLVPALLKKPGNPHHCQNKVLYRLLKTLHSGPRTAFQPSFWNSLLGCSLTVFCINSWGNAETGSVSSFVSFADLFLLLFEGIPLGSAFPFTPLSHLYLYRWSPDNFQEALKWAGLPIMVLIITVILGFNRICEKCVCVDGITSVKFAEMEAHQQCLAQGDPSDFFLQKVMDTFLFGKSFQWMNIGCALDKLKYLHLLYSLACFFLLTPYTLLVMRLSSKWGGLWNGGGGRQFRGYQ